MILTDDKTIFVMLFQKKVLRIYSCKSHYKVTEMCQNKRNINIRLYNTIHWPLLKMINKIFRAPCVILPYLVCYNNQLNETEHKRLKLV